LLHLATLPALLQINFLAFIMLCVKGTTFADGLGMILIVENDCEMREVLLDMVRDLGRPVRQAGNGYEAFKQIAGYLPALIITELEMPGGGLNYIALLRRHLPLVPILVLTTFGGQIKRADVLNWGATEYLTKPVLSSELRNTALELLTGRAHS
jgi:CheY-like chemotaxis protein